jgi:hypothetical protein
MAAEQILGPDVGSLKGKTMRRKGEHVAYTSVPVPDTLMLQYRDVTMGADIMFVNKLPFFVTISRNIKFCTAQLIPKSQTGNTRTTGHTGGTQPPT